MGVVEAFFILVALAAGAYGFLTLTQATEGVGFIAFALLAGVFARIAQAAKHQEENKKHIGSAPVKPPYDNP